MDDLLQQLDCDRSWLLQQIDGGRWPELRLDLAALERELGQLITCLLYTSPSPRD